MIPAPIRHALAAWLSWRRRRRLARAYPELDALRQRRALLSRQHRSTRHADAAIRRAMTERLTVEMWEAMVPISPDKMKLYPGGGTHSKEWKAFRASIIDRAGNRCEGTPQHPDCRAENGKQHPVTGSKVVLTIAHMDWDESHADPLRCRALCQRCHLTWDAAHHAKNAARTRRRNQPQIDLEDWLAAK